MVHRVNITAYNDEPDGRNVQRSQKQPQPVMERCSTRNHENATADPSAAPQDDSAKGDDATYFQGRSFDFVDRSAINFAQDDNLLL
jgi:hypothetical protein